MALKNKRTAIPLGATSRAVAANVQKFRKVRGLTQEELADDLTEAGHPLAVPAIRAIENGRRRIDVDDLTALAFALRVSPIELLLPIEDGITGVPKEHSRFEIAKWMKEETALDDAALMVFWTNKRVEWAKDLEEAIEVRTNLIASKAAPSYVSIPEQNIINRLSDLDLADKRIAQLSKRTSTEVSLSAADAAYTKGAKKDPLLHPPAIHLPSRGDLRG